MRWACVLTAAGLVMLTGCSAQRSVEREQRLTVTGSGVKAARVSEFRSVRGTLHGVRAVEYSPAGDSAVWQADSVTLRSELTAQCERLDSLTVSADERRHQEADGRTEAATTPVAWHWWLVLAVMAVLWGYRRL